MEHLFMMYVVFGIFCLDMSDCRSLWERIRNRERRPRGSPFDNIIPIDMEMLDALARIQFHSSLLSNINTHQEVTQSTATRPQIVGDMIPFGARPRVRVNPIDVTEPIGATITLHCHVSGPGPHDIRWRRSDGRLLSARAVLHGRHRLTLSQLQFKDSGRYTCRVANRYGVTKRSVVVSVVDDSGTRFQQTHTGELRALTAGEDT